MKKSRLYITQRERDRDLDLRMEKLLNLMEQHDTKTDLILGNIVWKTAKKKNDTNYWRLLKRLGLFFRNKIVIRVLLVVIASILSYYGYPVTKEVMDWALTIFG